MERQSPRKHRVNDNSGGPHISLLRVSLFLKHLRGDIGGGATRFKHELPWHDDLAQAEICQLNLMYLVIFTIVIQFYHDILGLQISMNDPAKVQVLKGLEYLICNEACLLLSDLSLFDVFKEFASLDLLHDDKHVLESLKGIYHLHHIWMRYRPDNLYFISKEVSFLP